MVAKKTSLWKPLRITILLLVLLIVAANAWKDNNQNWNQPIFIALYPVNADQSTITQSYISNLKETDFLPIADFIKQQAKIYQQPVYVYFRLGQQITVLPPKVPETTALHEVVLWSLKFRYYAWRNQQKLDVSPNLTLYLNYYDSNKHRVLKHSTALQNGRIGVVNLFADQKQNDQNQIVIAHEMLHAFGATDQYDLSTGQPIYPQGYADPKQNPLYPQTRAELMAGHIAMSETKSKMADSLKYVVINSETAKEIGWLK